MFQKPSSLTPAPHGHSAAVHLKELKIWRYHKTRNRPSPWLTSTRPPKFRETGRLSLRRTSRQFMKVKTLELMCSDMCNANEKWENYQPCNVWTTCGLEIVGAGPMETERAAIGEKGLEGSLLAVGTKK